VVSGEEAASSFSMAFSRQGLVGLRVVAATKTLVRVKMADLAGNGCVVRLA
jgi:hypothetical protein